MGGRKNNEDYCLHKNGIWIVADGLGGHDSGEIASETACRAISEYVDTHEINAEDAQLADIINVANTSVIKKQKSDPSLASMRTTIVFAMAHGESLRYANVGDSRFYYFRDGQMLLHSEDHSVSAASVKLGDLSFEEIRNDPDKNKLLKVLGDNDELSVKIPQKVISLKSGDAFLLCSDGFWEHVYETEMEIDLVKSSNPREWINYMAKRIILKTKNNGNDNFTAIGVFIE